MIVQRNVCLDGRTVLFIRQGALLEGRRTFLVFSKHWVCSPVAQNNIQYKWINTILKNNLKPLNSESCENGTELFSIMSGHGEDLHSRINQGEGLASYCLLCHCGTLRRGKSVTSLFVKCFLVVRPKLCALG